ncbi:hypothetical protein KFE25_006180 [Diacronema lutheri]|uniref:Fatty acid desaturase domain-containing protein n=2 Tax=Diacronema lutheri TaxID=2081491 RepID=A0A8J5XXG9_DIALT|nr:hypothetical protein KFE25_006180 [Diacronema lutheri]
MAVRHVLRSRVALLALVNAMGASTHQRTVSSTLAGLRAATSPADWHRARRQQILEEAPAVRELIGADARTLPLLVSINAAQFGCAVAAAQHLPNTALVPAALTLGSTLSLWSFALLHDVAHSTAKLPPWLPRKRALSACSMPSVFGYFLYLRYGHLEHHKAFGKQPLSALFNSEQVPFEDGDALFVAHRQSLPGDAEGEPLGFFGEAVGGLGMSISRSFYALGWSDERGWMHNAAVYSAGMTFERAALCVNDKLTALIGRNLFFPHKPRAFHQTCATHARAQAAVHLCMLVLGGPSALVWLFCAELGWQLPCHPAFAMFVSNHPSIANDEAGMRGAAGGESLRGCQPTSSIYIGAVRAGPASARLRVRPGSYNQGLKASQ